MMGQHLYQRTYKFFNRQVHQVIDYFRRISFPGFERVPIYNVFSFFFRGLLKGSLNIRASSIAFNFLLALGPGIIFLLTLIPYLPINNFQQELMQIMFDVIPENSYIAIESLLAEIFVKRGGLQIFGLLTAFFFAQKGVNGMIEAFNATYHTIETGSWLERRLISVGLVFILAFLIATAIVLFIFSKTGIGKLAEYDIIKIDIPNRTLDVEISDNEIQERLANWKPFEKDIKNKALLKYRCLVSSAAEGAILKY